MYDVLVASASFWQQLREIDDQLCRTVQAAGCPRCAGRLDRSDYDRKPRGIGVALGQVFSKRLSTCCRDCRKRVTPPSVRFLGRRVYVGAIMILATIGVVVSGAVKRTLERWRSWWTTQLPMTSYWKAARGRLMPALQGDELPGALLKRFEDLHGESSQQGLLGVLGFVQPISGSRVCEHFDGQWFTGQHPQKMHSRRDRRSLLRRGRSPAKLN